MFRKKILVVDDSTFFAKVITAALTRENYEVVWAPCGEDGLRLVREEKPDLVLLDVVMPDISGFDVCRILRAAESNNPAKAMYLRYCSACHGESAKGDAIA